MQRRSSKHIQQDAGRLAFNLSVPPSLPKGVPDFGPDQVRCKQLMLAAESASGGFRMDLRQKPFDGNAGVHNVTAHRARSSRMSLALSLNLRPLKDFCHFAVTALNSLMGMGMVSCRIALTSPCKERPCRLALDLSRSIVPGSKSLTSMWGIACSSAHR